MHSLFGHMDQTNQMVEFEATQEYLGQAKHVCHLAPQWKSYGTVACRQPIHRQCSSLNATNVTDRC